MIIRDIDISTYLDISLKLLKNLKKYKLEVKK